MKNNVPKVGDEIYFPSVCYAYHGRDDFHGGLIKIRSIKRVISGGSEVHFIVAEEYPQRCLNWEEYLLPMQEELRARWGEERGYVDPDDDPMFNDDNADWRFS